MSSQSRTRTGRKPLAALVALGAMLGAMLGGCSDIYYDRRETVALGADDFIAANRVVQMVDPWPRDVGNKNIAFNGQRMQAAVERYRNNRVIPPVNVTTTSMTQAQAQAAAATANTATSQTTTQQQSAPAAAVRY
jgi:hypothetical protein